jgi:gamma-glutamyltranspeptidase
VESRVPARVLSALGRKGHPIKRGPEFLNRVGHAHGIAFADGLLTGGADPRGDGLALGF